MAQLTDIQIKKGKLQGTDGYDDINISEYAEKVSVYAGKGSDMIVSGKGKTTIYGQSGSNTYHISSDNTDTTIVPGVGKANINLQSFDGSMLEKVKNDLRINIAENNIVTIKDYFKNRGEIYVNGQDLRQLTIDYDYSKNKKVGLTTGFTRDNIHTNQEVAYNDVIKSLDGNDTIQTYGGNDTIYAGNGNDTINGGNGNDKLYGGTGLNTYEYDNRVFAGNDTIYIENGSHSNIRINKNEIANIYKSKNNLILENAIGEKITLANYFKYNTQVQINGEDIISIINQGTDNSFAITGKGKLTDTVFDDSITGSKGADKIYSHYGNDKIYAGKGNDKIYSSSGSANLYFNEGDGKDVIDGQFSNIYINTNNQITDISQLKLKLSGNDLIINYTQKDSITIKNYKDTWLKNGLYINGTHVAEDLYSLVNSYENIMELTHGNTKFYSMEENNTIILPNEFDLNNITNATKSGNNLVITGVWGAKDKLTIVDYYKNGYDIRFEKANGSFVGNLNNILETIYKANTYNNGDFSGHSYALKVTGGIINDYLTMTEHDDIVKAGHGHDYIDANNGNDKVWGGTGNDTIEGDLGNDKLYGESGNDLIFGKDDNDYIDGGSGNDEIFGGNGFDTIRGGSGNDIIAGDNGNDLLKGDAGNDDIGGNIGNDTIEGGSGNDSIDGHDGNDLIKGGSGNDVITCNSGQDTIYGNAGNDTIVVSSSYTEIYGGNGNDYIHLESNSAEYVEIEAGSGNDIIELSCRSAEVEGGSGNDTIIFHGGNVEAEGGSGNDTYTVRNLASGNKLDIDDSSGKDTLNITTYGKDDIRFIFDVEINSKGKIIDSKDIDVKIMHYQVFNGFIQNYSANNLDRMADGVTIDDYFGSGCIETINAGGYYVTKTQLNNVMQEVAAWLSDKGYNSVDQVLSVNNSDTQALLQIFNDVNWQQ